jgi:UV DNA damage endonuclease
MVRLGYACINMELQEQKPRISSNRSMIKRTFEKKGIPYASELGLQNVKDLKEIIKWNNANGVQVFRISSCLFPWFSEYQLEQLPDYEEICAELLQAGELARKFGQRLSFHPGQFNILASGSDKVVSNTIKELNDHSRIFDIMGFKANHWTKINIHVGGAYGDRALATERWCRNFELLDENTKCRLTVENDDKPALYSTKMLYNMIYKRTGTPIVFDSHHFACGPQDSTYHEAIDMAAETWPDGIRPTCHHSNSRKNYEDSSVTANAHSDWYYEPFIDHGHGVDVVLECKKKERALAKYIQDFM